MRAILLTALLSLTACQGPRQDAPVLLKLGDRVVISGQGFYAGCQGTVLEYEMVYTRYSPGPLFAEPDRREPLYKISSIRCGGLDAQSAARLGSLPVLQSELIRVPR